MPTINKVPFLLNATEKAFGKFLDFSKNLVGEQNQAGAVQAFEYTYELSWKLMKASLENNGISAQSPKEVFRLAAKSSIIPDPGPWFEFLEIRNKTVHTYDLVTLQMILTYFPSFSTEVKNLVNKIKNEVDSIK